PLHPLATGGLARRFHQRPRPSTSCDSFDRRFSPELRSSLFIVHTKSRGGPVIRFSRLILLTAFLASHIALPAQEAKPDASSIPLPTSKTLTIPTPGRIGPTNSFPATIAISPDGRYAALLNDGYVPAESMAIHSIAVLDLLHGHGFLGSIAM